MWAEPRGLGTEEQTTPPCHVLVKVFGKHCVSGSTLVETVKECFIQAAEKKLEHRTALTTMLAEVGTTGKLGWADD